MMIKKKMVIKENGMKQQKGVECDHFYDDDDDDDDDGGSSEEEGRGATVSVFWGRLTKALRRGSSEFSKASFQSPNDL